MALNRIHVYFNIPSHSGDQVYLEQFVSGLIILVLDQITQPPVILDWQGDMRGYGDWVSPYCYIMAINVNKPQIWWHVCGVSVSWCCS